MESDDSVSLNSENTDVIKNPYSDSNKSLNPHQTNERSNNTIYRIQVKILVRKKDKNSSINVYHKFTNLMTNIFKCGKISLLPFDDNNYNNVLTQASEIPRSEAEFKEYCCDHHVNKSGNGLYFIFRINTNGIPFFKFKQSMFPWIKQNGVFMHKTILTSGRTCVLGWLKGSAPLLSNKSTIAKELQERFDCSIPFQITSRVLINKGIITKALAVECAIDQAKELLSNIFTKYAKTKKDYVNMISYKLQFIPTRPTGAITEQVIQKAMISQNHFLRHIRRIVISNVQDIDVEMPLPDEDNGIETSILSDWLQNAINPNNRHLPYLSSVDYGPNNKLYVYTLDTMLSDTTKWIENLYHQHICQLTNEQKYEFFGSVDPFQFYKNHVHMAHTQQHAEEITKHQNTNETIAESIQAGYCKPPVSKRPPQIIFSTQSKNYDTQFPNAWTSPLSHTTAKSHKNVTTSSKDTSTTITNSLTNASGSEDQIIEQLEKTIGSTRQTVTELEQRIDKQATALKLLTIQAKEQKDLIQALDYNHRNDMNILIKWMKVMAQTTGIASSEIEALESLCPNAVPVAHVNKRCKISVQSQNSNNEQNIGSGGSTPMVSMSTDVDMIE